MHQIIKLRISATHANTCMGPRMLQRAQHNRVLVALLGRGEGRGAGDGFAML